MQKFMKFFSLALVLTLATLSAQAQKYGYINSQAILAEMPEVRTMQTNLENLQTQMQKKGKQMLDQYQSKREDAAKREELGQLSPLEKQQLLTELTKLEEEIVALEQELVTTIEKKRNEELQPIYEKINNAVQNVAKEQGYAMIFEAGTLLYADEGTDVGPMVKSKLGM